MGKMDVDEQYVVEEVVNKRIRRGKVEYYVKWENYPSEQNTWEPRSHLKNCLDLIEKYENEHKNKGMRCSKGKSSFNNSKILDESVESVKNMSLNNSKLDSSLNGKTKHSFGPGHTKNLAGVELDDCEENKKKNRDSGPVGFSRGLKPKEIIGAVENDGIYCFLIRWHNCEETDIVPAKEAHKICPEIVIAFYEQRIAWKPNRAK